jgi:hypothetical protein
MERLVNRAARISGIPPFVTKPVKAAAPVAFRDNRPIIEGAVRCRYPKASRLILDEVDRVLARHYGFTPEEPDFIINYDTCLHCGFGRQVKYRLGRDAETPDE